MPLLSLWHSNPSAISQFSIQQIVVAAGSGNLTDGSDCSQELREYLSQAASAKLAEYANGCLSDHFNKSGLVLQDLVNELGRRLDYTVTNGRYQGTTNAIGFDGIWRSAEGRDIILEVKTTDAFSIALNTIAGYRERLIASNQVSSSSSILVVVGREDTGQFEAQIRGSRHAWDMRLISVDALLKLVQLKEDADGPETGRKIRSLLTPMEYTRLDQMIEIMFTTAKDVETAAIAEVGGDDEPEDASETKTATRGTWQFTERESLERKRELVVEAVAKKEGTSLIKKSRALYWNANHSVRAAFTISKRYARPGGPLYWYAYHPGWDDFLGEGKFGYFVLGCMDLDEAFAIPLDAMRKILDALNTTERDDGIHYWHIHIGNYENGQLALALPKRHSFLPLSEFATKLAN